MDATNVLGTREIGDGSRNAEYPVEAPCRQAHRSSCIRQQLAARLIRSGDLVE